jgi:hypothetical protein
MIARFADGRDRPLTSVRSIPVGHDIWFGHREAPGHLACRTWFDVMPDPKGHFLARSFGALQENVRRAGPAASAGYTLIGAIALLGGAGHLLDRWASTSSPWFLLAGMLLGVVVGFYELAKTVWKK